MRLSTAFLLLSACLAVGCSKPKLTPVKKPAVKKNLGTAWTLIENDPSSTLARVIGSCGDVMRVRADGTFDSDAFSVVWRIDGEKLTPVGAANYSQTLDFQRGEMTTTWVQTIKGRKFDVKTVSSPLSLGFRQKWSIKGDGSFHAELDKGRLFYSDRFGERTQDTISGEISNGELSCELDTVGLIHVPGPIHTSLTADIEIDGPLEDQQAVRSFLYYLHALYGPEQDNYSPMGDSNTVFANRTFWDADVWLLPALAFIDPSVAKSVATFRTNHADSDVYEQWLAQGRPTATNKTSEKDNGLASMAKAAPIKYPWQAGRSGEELSQQPTRFAEHVSGDVAWGLSFASDLGLASTADAKKVIDGVAAYYLHRAKIGSDQMVGIQDTVSVDEWHSGDDDLYTNALADWVIRRSLGNELWPADAMRYPNDYSGLLAYEGDPRKAYQQAAAQLVLWPLEMEGLVGDPIKFLDLFAGKEAPSGPAMSLSVDALIRARYGNANNALKTWRDSWKRYTDGNPFLLFSEKPNQPDRTYFGTGAAGCLNAVIYGFAGARIVEDASKDTAKIKVANDKWLVFRPNLPLDWKRLTLRDITVMGKKYDVECVGSRATIKMAGT